MPWGYAAVAVGTMYAANEQSNAISDASQSTQQSTQAGIDETRRQFDAVQKLLSPYVTAGNQSLVAQQDLLGLNGSASQQAAVSAVQASPQFQAMLKLGETGILQNASATGGLRGGNTQAALAQFSPALLAQQLEARYSQLGGITSIGQNAAARVGNAGMQSGNTISGLLGQLGASQAGAALAQGAVGSGIGSSLASMGGYYLGNRGSTGTYNPSLNSNIGSGTVSTDYSLGTGKF